MSDNKLKVTIREEINLNGDSYDALNINTLENINEISKRILTIPTGSEQEILKKKLKVQRLKLEIKNY